MAELPGELFTSASIITLTGATGAVYVICGALQRAFDFNPKWLAFVISLVIALAGAYATQMHHPVTYLVALVNGCLIFCTATGVNSVFGAAPPPPAVHKGVVLNGGVDRNTARSTVRRMFTTRWI